MRDGLVVVDKAPRWTSHDVVAHIRRRLGERRVGHAGTLDPDATGVLVVGVGSATRLLRFCMEGTKCYTGDIVFGVETHRAEMILRDLYKPFKAPIVVTDIKSAELIKHASNSFLALKISYANALAAVCE